MSDDQKVAHFKWDETYEMISEFDKLDLKTKQEGSKEYRGHLIQTAIVGAAIIGLVAGFGREELLINHFAQAGVILLAISVISASGFVIYAIETELVRAHEAYSVAQNRSFRMLAIWELAIKKEIKPQKAYLQVAAIADEVESNPWKTSFNRSKIAWLIFGVFAVGFTLLVASFFVSTDYRKNPHRNHYPIYQMNHRL